MWNWRGKCGLVCKPYNSLGMYSIAQRQVEIAKGAVTIHDREVKPNLA